MIILVKSVIVNLEKKWSLVRYSKKYRSKTKKTQQDVVDTLACDPDFEAISNVSYHRWESGKNLPSIKRQAKILLLLNCKKDLQKLASIYQ